jgi:hypothetical protein
MKRRLIDPTPIAIVVAVIALTTASSASAAVEFHPSKAGQVSIAANGTQKFTLAGGSSATCTEVSGSNKVAGGSKVSLTLLISLLQCEAFGSKVTASQGVLTFGANGSVGFFTQKVIFSSSIGKCSLIIGFGGTNGQLGTVKYSNLANGTIEGAAKIEGIEYEVSGPATSVCGANKEVNKAKYEGKFISTLAGGTIKVE